MEIRKATITDAKPVATCLLLAMEEIVYGFIGERDAEKARQLMEYFTARQNNQYSWENCRVAAEGKDIIGAINIYDGERLHTLRQSVIEYLRNAFNSHCQPEDETGPGEYYIDALGVKPTHREKELVRNSCNAP